jgi:hypothetical protein
VRATLFSSPFFALFSSFAVTDLVSCERATIISSFPSLLLLCAFEDVFNFNVT